MTQIPEVLFLFDVDNTLLDNDRVIVDLRRHLTHAFGAEHQERYWNIFEARRTELGYSDYLGSLQRYRAENLHDARFYQVSLFLTDYAFANRLFPNSLDVIDRFRTFGPVVILTDGDVVFQPRKIWRSGLHEAVDGNVLIYIHKETELADVEKKYPAQHYVLVDDKLRILTEVKKQWGSKVTTVFPRQGHYAHDVEALKDYPPADISIQHIGELLDIDLSRLIGAAKNQGENHLQEKGRNTMNAIRVLHDLGQSLWLDNITRGLLTSGTLKRYIQEFSVTGLTSNPTIFDHAIRDSDDYDEEMNAQENAGKSAEELFFELAVNDLRQAADLLAPVHEQTDGVDGWVSLEVSPLLADDTAGTVAAAKKLHAQAARPNLFIKIPGTKAGLPAIEEAIFAGVPINVTLLFSKEQYVATAEAYMRGIERRIAVGLKPNVPSVASIFVSRWDVAVHDSVPSALQNQLGIAVSKVAYKAYQEILESPRMQKLLNAGARPQRLLWASTGTKDPKLPKTFYVEALAASLTINTMPEKTIKALAELDSLEPQLTRETGAAENLLKKFAEAGVNVQALAARLQQEGAQSFTKSWTDLMACIAAKGRDSKGKTKPPTAAEAALKSGSSYEHPRH